MGLVIKHNRANHTHENEQFRRVAISLRLLFDKQGWDGILIGNPYNELYSRFRADAILFYSHGLIIIDFKVYSGTLRLPNNKGDFEMTQWYTESEIDKRRILVKAGSKFINPYKQLYSYREAFKEIIKNEVILNGHIFETKTCALNIFSGPLEVKNSIPKELPFYKITQESDLGTFLYDYASDNKFSKDIATNLSKVFRAEDWIDHIEMPIPVHQTENAKRIDKDVETEISDFLKSSDSGILVLESMESIDRDSWVQYILTESSLFSIPQIETWIHSARIGKRVSRRVGFELQSLYNTIYGGQILTLDADSNEEDESKESEHLQEIVAIRSDDSLDEAAVIILHEAHLVSRSLHQSEFLRFGTGRLLEDLLTFLDLKGTKRKLICIGDPYSITYGKDTECALNTKLLSELYSGKIAFYEKEPVSNDETGKFHLRNNLAIAINSNLYNRLYYPWCKDDLVEISKSDVTRYLLEWFSTRLDSEPSNSVMVYTNKDARTINTWIKSNCLKNGAKLAIGDLLLVNNNVNIPDDSGFGQPTKLYNGMYLQVESLIDYHTEQVTIRQSNSPINLNFTKVKVKCLSLPNRLLADVWLLNNYMESDEKLSKNEQVALRVYANKLVKLELDKQPFESSRDFEQMKQDEDYIKVVKEEYELKVKLDNGERVKTEYESKGVLKRKIEAKYKKRYRNRLLSNITKNNSLVNAIFPTFGWAITVHKAVGSAFTNVILNAFHGENKGIANSDYFRWLYTASTSTSGAMYVANPQAIHPLMDVHFEDVSIISNPDDKISSILLSYPGYKTPEKYLSIFPNDINEHVKGGVCELSLLLEPLGYVLDGVHRNNEYLTKATYSIPSSVTKKLIISFNNKGIKDNWGLSSIRIEKSEGENEQPIQACIAELYKNAYSHRESHSIAFPDDFRGKIYNEWFTVLKTHDFNLKLIEEHSHQDILSVNSTNQKATFRIYYTKEGFFSQFIMISKSSENLGSNLKKWLIDGD